MMQQQRPLVLINARLSAGEVSRLRLVNGRIAAVGADPCDGDLIVDLQGDWLLPGLINAHDHLQLNGAGVGASGRYSNARNWIAAVNRRRAEDSEFRQRIGQPRDARLLLGGIKNLLSGVTTVVHHDPLYPALCRDGFPVQVLRDYGWSHSLYVDGAEAVRRSYLETPKAWPWMIHAGEGLDEEAQAEFERLESLGCIGANTRLIHGVAFTRQQLVSLQKAGGALIWCPSSNLHLFSKTADVHELAAAGCVALGSDSRLTGARDLLEELRIAAAASDLNGRALEAMVTHAAARLLGLNDRGALEIGRRADLLILPADTMLGDMHRSQVRLVIIGGVARYGDPEYTRLMSTDSVWEPIKVDGFEKSLLTSLGAALRAAQVCDEGVELSPVAGRAA